MPQTCSVCKSKRRSEIEVELIQGAALRNIAKRYGGSAAGLYRHKRDHLPEKLTLAKQQQDTLSAESLLAEMAALKARLGRGLEQAEIAGNPAAFVAFAREYRQCLECCYEISERTAGKYGGNAPPGLAERLQRALRERQGLTESERGRKDPPVSDPLPPMAKRDNIAHKSRILTEA